MEAEVGAERHGGYCLSHKRADPEGVGNGNDAKRPREGGDRVPGSMEMEDDDDYPDLLNPLDAYRQWWVVAPRRGAFFEEETDIPPMRYTDGPMLPYFVAPMDTIQVFSLKVTQIADPLQWPLHVYGVVAVRDTKDHKRNILFRRGRDECQTLTSPQVSALELRGPSRAILLLDPPAFEIDLKVKGNGSASEDRTLSYYLFLYSCVAHWTKDSYAITKVVHSEHSTMEVRYAHLASTVEATIAVRVVSGSDNFKARFTARTESIVDEDVVLLDSCGGKVAVDDDGLVVLRRRVVVVEEKGMLVLGVEAVAKGGDAVDQDGINGADVVVKKKMKFDPRPALRTEGYFNMGFSKLHVVIAWSMPGTVVNQVIHPLGY